MDIAGRKADGTARGAPFLLHPGWPEL